MTIALDLGASGLRSLRVTGERLAARCARAVYSTVEDSPTRRQMLDQLGMMYAVCDGSIAIPGDAARDLAELFHVPVLPLLPQGRLPEGDPPARQMLASLIEALLPPPTTANELCGVTLPGSSGSHDTETARFLLHLIRLRGYIPKPISPATALVLAELVGDGFTGVGITFGAAACHVSLVNRSMEIATCCIEQAGSWIDGQMAEAGDQYLWDARGNKYLDDDAMRRWKESGTAQIDDPSPNERDQNLSRLYAEVIAEMVATAGRAFREALLLPQSWPGMSIVVCGGSTRVRGFIPKLAQAIREADWPVRIKQIRQAEDSDLTIARGALIHAELESQPPGATGRAA